VTESIPPSGEQVEITHGDQRAVVVEVGGAVRAYAVGDWEVLDGYGPDEMASGARGNALLPWPNRTRDGQYEFDGAKLQLALTEPANRNAIHGLARWVNWTVGERDEHRVAMRLRLHAQAGWPFLLDLQVAYALDDDGLTVTTTATNIGTQRCPFGSGAHPYLTVGTERIDEAILEAPGATWLPSDDRGIPTGREAVGGTEYDFLEARPVGDAVLDTGYADLRRDDDGRVRVRLSAPGGERSVALWLDGAYEYLMLFTGDSLPDEQRRRRALGVEPMTCAPNALQTGDGLRVLEPGESFTGSWGIGPSR